MKTWRTCGCVFSFIAALPACSNADNQAARGNADEQPSISRSTSELISDDAHSGEEQGFFFLPPMVANPDLVGTFDSGQSPVVRIDEMDAAATTVLREVVTFTMTSGPDSETIRLEPDHYIVNWHTGEFSLDPALLYRIRVLLEDRQVGFADVDLVSSGRELRRVERSDYVPLRNGRTLPIKFWMNLCASIECTALDQCHVPGECDPSTGECSNPAAEDGIACNDGDLCTRIDTCQGGLCLGAEPVQCTALDQCHVAGVCDPATGVCSNPSAADGTACDDDDRCTRSDTCQSGVCTGADPVICAALDQCYVPGECDPLNGECSNPAAPQGTACEDGLFCTDGDVCDGAGTCISGDTPCSPGEVCIEEQARCCPLDCGGRSCGPDGCGGTCAPGCGPEETCVEASGQCIPTVCVGIDCSGHGTCVDDGGVPQCVCDPGYHAEGLSCVENDTYCETYTCWPIPPTGQTLCYEGAAQASCAPFPCQQDGGPDYCGQDAQYPEVSRTFTESTIGGDGVVQDSLTGLMWASIDTPSVNWTGAVAHCDGLNTAAYASYTDWRLPHYNELATLVNYSPQIPTSDFPNMLPVKYWSGTRSALDSASAWAIRFLNAIPDHAGIENVWAARCVRGEPYSSSPSRYRITGSLGSETVLDRATGLVWQKEYTTGMGWQDTLQHCEALHYAGSEDWRLPNANELYSVSNLELYDPASDFPDMPSIYFWSSTTRSDMPSQAWSVRATTGHITEKDKTELFAARCVRNRTCSLIFSEDFNDNDISDWISGSLVYSTQANLPGVTGGVYIAGDGSNRGGHRRSLGSVILGKAFEVSARIRSRDVVGRGVNHIGLFVNGALHPFIGHPGVEIGNGYAISGAAYHSRLRVEKQQNGEITVLVECPYPNDEEFHDVVVTHHQDGSWDVAVDGVGMACSQNIPDSTYDAFTFVSTSLDENGGTTTNALDDIRVFDCSTCGDGGTPKKSVGAIEPAGKRAATLRRLWTEPRVQERGGRSSPHEAGFGCHHRRRGGGGPTAGATSASGQLLLGLIPRKGCFGV